VTARPTRRKRRAAGGTTTVDLTVRIGSTVLPNPIMTASGTAGYGDELAGYLPLAALGAVVVKSQGIEPWAGNPPPRVHETPGGMLNSVGLQGEGVKVWLADELPSIERHDARVVASIWGRTTHDFRAAAEVLGDPPDSVVALEVNLSCPNLHGHEMFAQSAKDAASVVAAVTSATRLPVWAKLTAQVTDVVSIATAVRDAGAGAVTLVNTLPGMVIDTERRRPVLGAGGGGLSGPAIHPIAVRTVYDVHHAIPDLPIVGVGGVSGAAAAIELILAGAAGVQIGTANFADPRATMRVLDELAVWCDEHGIRTITDLIGGAHHES
jgi:dihydroorotate dehydrogenase (NAD+) catalytic subunit